MKMSSISMAIDSQSMMHDGHVRGEHDKHGHVYCTNDNGGCYYALTAPREGDGDDDDGDGGYDFAPAA